MDQAKVALTEQRQDQLEVRVGEMVASVNSLTGELSKLTLTMSESIVEQRGTRDQLTRMYSTIESLQKRTTDIEKVNSSNQPYIDTVKLAANRAVFIIVTAIAGSIAVASYIGVGG